MPQADYAIAHYLSPNRRDNVKINWEEPFSCKIFEKAIKDLKLLSKDNLRVLDIGAGLGDGFRLLQNVMSSGVETDKTLHYLGVDMNPGMIDEANKLHADYPNCQFKQLDIREGPPSQPFNLYISCGIPYSYLTNDELKQTLARIFENIKDHQLKSTVIINVLGRYSIEWMPMWSETQWNYRMSFFENGKTISPGIMSFYSKDHLKSIINEASQSADCMITDLKFFDRSIMVGRHTSTGEFNNEIPPYRTLINSLMDPDQTTNLEQLISNVNLEKAPDYILNFFEVFLSDWNYLVHKALNHSNKQSLNIQTKISNSNQQMDRLFEKELYKNQSKHDCANLIEATLADCLRELESYYNHGYGVGHDLYCIACIN